MSQITSKVLYIYMTRHYFFLFRGGGPAYPRHFLALQLLLSLLFTFINLMVSLYQRSCASLRCCSAAAGIPTLEPASAFGLESSAGLFLLRSPIFEFLYLSVS